MNNYKPTIGIEIHLELKTNAKAFSLSPNNYNSSPNTNINEIDLGYPGTLPIVNENVVKQAIKACLGLNMNITRRMHFDRKNYFYPDLPKGYQITQFETPIGRDGFVEIETSDLVKKIGISDLHIEEDTCKSLHYNGKTLLNYNRSGVPLLEIVSSPDMHSKEEAMAYAETVREIMLYLGVSDCKIEEGSMRCDVNISISKDNTLGVRSEIKNIGSISNIGEAIDYEIQRQSLILEKGEKLFEDTRRFDSETGTTIFMRKKEPNKDYRYFPEPDIPYLVLEESMIKEEQDSLIMLPNERRRIYLNKGVSKINIEKLISNKDLSDFFGNFLDSNINLSIASNILVGDIASFLNKKKISIFDTKMNKEKFIAIVNSLSKEEISSKIFKEILPSVMEEDIPIETILENNKQVDSKEEVEKVITDVLNNYPQSVEDYKNGKDNAIKFLMGMIMKETKGKINPKLAMEILKDNLDK
ncbi:MAG: Asp-tRNA(Asn)/Glu-tRNA(Gln) amidotransferase subunit GatB [Bacilli bacterium]